MIKNKGWKLLGMMCVCSAVLFTNPANAEAAEAEEGAVVKVEAEQVSLYSEMSAESAVVEHAAALGEYMKARNVLINASPIVRLRCV